MRNKTPKILSLMLLTLALLVLSTLWSSAETAADAADTADAAVDTGELSSGNYQIKVSATHPETGEVFITTRSVQLLAAANGAKFGVRYPFGNGTYGYESGNSLNFVPSMDGVDKTKSMSLTVVDPSYAWAPHFRPTPLAAVSQTTPIDLGDTADPAANNRIGLTFEAFYDPQQIHATDQWSVFYLSYAFVPTS